MNFTFILPLQEDLCKKRTQLISLCVNPTSWKPVASFCTEGSSHAGLDGGGWCLQRSPGSPLRAKVAVKLVGPIKSELAGLSSGAFDLQSLTSLLAGEFNWF